MTHSHPQDGGMTRGTPTQGRISAGPAVQPSPSLTPSGLFAPVPMLKKTPDDPQSRSKDIAYRGRVGPMFKAHIHRGDRRFTGACLIGGCLVPQSDSFVA